MEDIFREMAKGNLAGYLDQIIRIPHDLYFFAPKRKHIFHNLTLEKHTYRKGKIVLR